MSDKHHMGACACGRVRYRMAADPLIVHACHCRMCQRLTGSTNAVNVLIEADKLILVSGETTEHMALTPSGAGQNITRCAHCKVAVWSEYLLFTKRRGGSLRFVRAGTLDHPENFPPDVHIFTDSMQPHASLDGGVPAYPSFYDVGKVWSDESIRRLESSAVPAAAQVVE